MGFGASIIKFNRNRMSNPNLSDKEIIDNFNDIYKEACIDWEKDYVEDWCSAGRYWFDDLSGYVEPIDASNGYYVINKKNYGDLAKYAMTLMNNIRLEGYHINKSLTYVDDEHEDYICKNVDGILLSDEERCQRELWTCCDDYDLLTVWHYVGYDEYYSIFTFVNVVLSLASTDWDNEVVIISGGY